MADELKALIKKMGRVTSKFERQMAKSKYKTFSTQQKNFEDATALLFKQFPKLERFSWRQYTPHWNDGDTCQFSARTEYIEVNGEQEVCCYNLEEKLKRIKNKKKVRLELEKELAEAKSNQVNWKIEEAERKLKELDEDPAEIKAELKMVESIMSILNALSDDVFLEMFGDHVEVTVTANGAVVENYQHD